MQYDIRCPFCRRKVGSVKGTDSYNLRIRKAIDNENKGYVCTKCSRCDKEFYIFLEFKN